MAIDVAVRPESRAGRWSVWYGAYTATLTGVMIAAGVPHRDVTTVGSAYFVALLGALGWCGFVSARPAGPTLVAALCLVGAEMGSALVAETRCRPVTVAGSPAWPWS